MGLNKTSGIRALRCGLTLRVSIILMSLLLLTSAGFCYYFGKNKVQYHDIEWQELRTEHLNIYYYEGERELAEMSAVMGEEIISELEIRLHHTLTREIPLIIYSVPHIFQETNIIPFIIPESVAGVTEFFKGRVLVPFNGSLSGFRDTLHHEIVHYFQLNKIKYQMRRYRIYDYSTPPLWFMEGTAEYFSSVWDTQADMVMADAVIHEYFAPLEHISSIYGSYLLYKEGQDLINFIARTYGEDKIPQLIENMKSYKNWKENMEFTLGVSYQHLSDLWTRDVKSRYYPLIDKHQDPEIDYNHIKGRRGLNLSPVVYNDGEKTYLIYQSNEGGYSNIYRGELVNDFGDKIRLEDIDCIVKGERTEELESLHLYSSRMDVWGDELAFISKSGGGDVIIIYDLVEDELTTTISVPDSIGIASPSFSPEGKRLVFSSVDITGRQDIYIYHRDTGEFQRLTGDWYSDRDPIFTADGEVVIFSSDRVMNSDTPVYNLYHIKIAEPGEIIPLTENGYNNLTPTTFMDNKIVFSSDRNGFYNIYALDMNTGEVSQITNAFTGCFEPEYCKSNDTLFFVAYCNISMNIYSITPELIPEKKDNMDIPSITQFIGDRDFNIKESDISWREYDYDIDFSLDFAQAQVAYAPGYATQTGFVLYFTDMLNNHNLQVHISNTAKNMNEFFSHFNVATYYYNTGSRLNYGLGGFHLYDDYYREDGLLWYSEESLGGSALFLYPFSKFIRLETGVSFYRSTRDYYYTQDKPTTGYMTSNYLSLIKDTTLWGRTGPIDGARYNITLSQTTDVSNKKFRYFLFSGDFRKYFRLSKNFTYAVRTYFRSSTGPDSLPIYAGGSLSMRGYKYNDFVGTKFFMVNQELRFPIFKSILVSLPFGNLSLGGLNGAFFFDVGEAWTGKPGGLRGDFGFGLRWGLGGILVFRLDIAKKTDFKEISEDTPIRFFVGWDF
jgi:hypothetical protein